MSSTGKPLQFISSLLLFSSFSLFSCRRCWVWKHSVECKTDTRAGKGSNLSYKKIFIVQNTALILLAQPLCYGVGVEAVAGAEPWHAHTELELPGAHRIWEAPACEAAASRYLLCQMACDLGIPDSCPCPCSAREEWYLVLKGQCISNWETVELVAYGKVIICFAFPES